MRTTFTYDFSPNWAVSLQFGETVAKNEFGLDGKLYHFKLISRF